MKRRFGLLFLAVALVFASTLPAAYAQAQAGSRPALEVITRGDIDAATVASYHTVFEQVVSFYTQEFGAIPIPVIRIRLYATVELFEQGLISLGYSPENARRWARLFSGFAIGRDTIIISIARKPGEDRPRARLRWTQYVVAHEVHHLIQRAWLGEAPWAPMWLIEGMTGAYTVRFFRWIDDMAMYNHVRRGTLAAVQARWNDLQLAPLPYSVEDWINAHATHGSVYGFPVIYAYARVIYEYLESRSSREAILTFFAMLRDGASSRAAFERAFGMTLETFKIDLRAHVPTLFR
jgi:hypothetical protein